jgi:hypothetical protein
MRWDCGRNITAYSIATMGRKYCRSLDLYTVDSAWDPRGNFHLGEGCAYALWAFTNSLYMDEGKHFGQVCRGNILKVGFKFLGRELFLVGRSVLFLTPASTA